MRSLQVNGVVQLAAANISPTVDLRADGLHLRQGGRAVRISRCGDQFFLTLEHKRNCFEHSSNALRTISISEEQYIDFLSLDEVLPSRAPLTIERIERSWYLNRAIFDATFRVDNQSKEVVRQGFFIDKQLPDYKLVRIDIERHLASLSIESDNEPRRIGGRVIEKAEDEPEYAVKVVLTKDQAQTLWPMVGNNQLHIITHQVHFKSDTKTKVPHFLYIRQFIEDGIADDSITLVGRFQSEKDANCFARCHPELGTVI